MSNLDEIILILESLGYAVLAVRLSPQDHGVPHRRMRQWVLGFRVSLGPIDEAMRQKFWPMLSRCDRIMSDTMCTPLPLDAFLMSEDSEELKAWQQWRQDLLAEDRASKEDVDWPDVHSQVYRAEDMVYPPTLEAKYSPEEIKRLELMPRRAQECVAFVDFKEGLLDASAEEEIMDVGQAITRVPRCKGACPCIVPNAMSWLRRRRRLVEPCEALALQGLPLYRIEQLRSFKPCHILIWLAMHLMRTMLLQVASP